MVLPGYHCLQLLKKCLSHNVVSRIVISLQIDYFVISNAVQIHHCTPLHHLLLTGQTTIAHIGVGFGES